MRVILNQVPLLRLLVPFSGGILFSIYSRTSCSGIAWQLLLLLLFLLLPFVIVRRLYSSFRLRWVFGLLSGLAFSALGCYIPAEQSRADSASHFRRVYEAGDVISAYLQEPLKEKEKTYSSILQVVCVSGKNGNITAGGKLLAYFEKDSFAASLHYGDEIVFDALPSAIPPPGNPAEFNYADYMTQHGIYHRVMIENGQWKKMGENRGSWIKASAVRVRENLVQAFEDCGVTGEELAVISALVLGYMNEMDASLMKAYSGAGVMHILSVSGMHVGMVYAALNLLLFFMDRNRGLRFAKTVILIFSLWCYAFLTGFSPAVQRAAAMLSFVLLGKIFDRQASIYNSLAASAFFLLLFNPFLIMDTGFRLSYLAVAGIVLIHPVIYSLWEPSSVIMDKVWALVSVSVSAQIATFPLAVYCFHQFPDYFIFSNLIVIPLSTLIVYSGILLLVICPWHAAGLAGGKLLSYMVLILNKTAYTVESLPFAVRDGIFISPCESWLLFLMVIFFFLFFMMRRSWYVLIALLLTLLFSSMQLLESVRQSRQRIFTVYAEHGTFAYGFIEGKKMVLLSDSVIRTGNYPQSRGVEEKQIIAPGSVNDKRNFITPSLSRSGDFFMFCGRRVAIVRDTSFLSVMPTGRRLSLDYLVLSGNVKIKIGDLRRLFCFRALIFDSSNSPYRISLWRRECRVSHVRCHSVPMNGAFSEEW